MLKQCTETLVGQGNLKLCIRKKTVTIRHYKPRITLHQQKISNPTTTVEKFVQITKNNKKDLKHETEKHLLGEFQNLRS